MVGKPCSGCASLLIGDRLADFRRLAQSKGNLQPEASDTTAAQNNFMREFFNDVSAIQRILKEGRASTNRFKDVEDTILQATRSDIDREAMELLRTLVEETNGHVTSAKAAFDALRDKCQNMPRSAEHRIRENMLRLIAQKHQQLLIDFQKAQVACKTALERREFHDMQLVCPDASAEEVHSMIQAGETSQQLVVRKVAGTHALLLDEVQRIQEKHEDILRLESSVADLHQMFLEVAALVDTQGEMLNVIEENVHSAVSSTEKVNKELTTAVTVQRSTRKWECCLVIVLLIIAAAVFAPMVFSFSTDGSTALSWGLVAVFSLIILIGAGCCYWKFRSYCSAFSKFKKMPELPV